MAITRVGGSNGAGVGSGNFSVAYIAGIAANDIAVIHVCQRDNVVSTLPSGWTKVFEQNNGTGLRGYWAWRRLDGTESGSVTITRAGGNTGIASMSVYRGVRATGDPGDQATARNNASSATITADSITTGAAGCMVLFMASKGQEGTTATYAATDPSTFTERHDNNTTSGNDGGVTIADAIRTTAGSTGNATCTQSINAVSIGFLVELVPEPVAAPTPIVPIQQLRAA